MFRTANKDQASTAEYEDMSSACFAKIRNVAAFARQRQGSKSVERLVSDRLALLIYGQIPESQGVCDYLSAAARVCQGDGYPLDPSTEEFRIFLPLVLREMERNSKFPDMHPIIGDFLAAPYWEMVRKGSIKGTLLEELRAFRQLHDGWRQAALRDFTAEELICLADILPILIDEFERVESSEGVNMFVDLLENLRRMIKTILEG